MLPLSIFLAQATTDISGVPAEYVKNFFIMVAFLGGLGGAYFFGQRGTKGSPVHIEQPVKVQATVTQTAEHAHQSDLDELKELFHAERAANMSEHNTHRASQAAMMRELLEKGNNREQKLTAEIHQAKDELMRALLEQMKGMHERVNPVAETVKGHGKAIEGLKEQLKILWDLIAPLLGLKKGK